MLLLVYEIGLASLLVERQFLMSGPSYDDAFYQELGGSSRASAATVLDAIWWLLDEPESVIDFGCGTGAWLAEAKRKGCSELVGLEGPWVNSAKLAEQDIHLVTTMLDEPTAVSGAYDLAMSLEVAEHLPQERADGFIAELCESSRRVLFSAAIPGQGGTGHINEQWPSYWADKFRARGYLPIDVVRPLIFRSTSVNSWYRNNTFLYVPEDDYEEAMLRVIEHRPGICSLDFVIRDWYEQPKLRQSLVVAAGIPSLILAAVKRRL